MPCPKTSAATAAAAAIAVAVSTAAATATEVSPGGIGSHHKEECQQDNALYIHRIETVSQAISQAMTHWKTRMMQAQVLPSSLRMVAMAATHGV